ncbi:MAG: hypothetical protein JWN56_2934 [Sphingobacteriales bacterium]|nr:hypothetical protein [Sphingobacteriales bacterium]
MTLFLRNKKLIFRLLASLILTIISARSKAQLFDSEQNPPNLKWRQINCPDFQIIYPTELGVEAQRMANTLQSIISRVSQSLKIKPQKISVILQNQSTSSNGFVQLAPRRSEFFTTPPQDFDFQDWLNSLAVHELRHVVQFDKLTGELKAPLFEQLALAIFGISLPPWFYEGDAVGIETSLTESGRGRLPSWDIILRTNTLSGKLNTYSKDYFGSAKTLTPGFYQLGYFMTSKLRRDYGVGILDSVMQRISNNPIRPYNLSNSIKKFTHLNTPELHQQTIKELSKLWNEQLEKVNPKSYTTLNIREEQTPISYLLPIAISRSEVLVLKQSKAQTAAFTIINMEGKERKLLRIGIQENPQFNYANGQIIWEEFRFDKRYQKRSFNVINLYNINTKKYRQVTNKTRLFSPALSPDGKRFIAVNISEQNQVELVEFDTNSGSEIKRYLNPLNLTLQAPQYNQTGDKIIVTGVNKNGETLCEANVKTGTFKQLITFQKQQITHPFYAGDQILFSAHYNGINNIYSLDTTSLQIVQLTSSKYGAFNPSYSQFSKKILFNNFEYRGNDVSEIDLSSTSGTPINQITNTFVNYSQPLSAQEGNVNVFDSIPTVTYPTSSYHELSNLFNFHSIIPIVAQNDLNDKYNLGFQLVSNNKLNTLDLYTGYQYNQGLKRSEYLAGFTYKRFYPILNVQYINRARLGYVSTLVQGVKTVNQLQWRENFLEFSAEVPFTFNRRNYIYSTGFKLSSSYTSRYDFDQPNITISQNIRFPLKYQAYFNRSTTRSSRDLAPRWGQSISLSYQHFPFENKIDGSLFTFNSQFYAPGLFSNHSLQAAFNYEDNFGIYNNSVNIPQVSGHLNITHIKPVYNTLLLDYRFPLFYPDLEIGPFAYIKRLKAGVFADYENLGATNSQEPKTFGFELKADMNLLRFYLPNFELGGKLIFVNGNSSQNPIFEFGFNYNY